VTAALRALPGIFRIGEDDRRGAILADDFRLRREVVDKELAGTSHIHRQQNPRSPGGWKGRLVDMITVLSFPLMDFAATGFNRLPSSNGGFYNPRKPEEPRARLEVRFSSERQG